MREDVASLSTEFGVYLYYSVTLLEFFGTEELSIETLKEAESSGALEQLTEARQIIGFSPHIAESVITAFRESYKLAIP